MNPPLRILLGPTASGKESVALEVAARLGATILSVDSMKIYQEMDLGTAKPTPAMRARVPHRLVDFVPPEQGFSVAMYRDAAETEMAALDAAGSPFILSGGTALYYKALTEGLFDGPGTDPDLRAALMAELEREGEMALHAELAAVDAAAAARIHPHDHRRLIRALEVIRQGGRPLSALQTQFGKRRTDRRIAMVGLHWSRAQLHERIALRVERMVAAGLFEEAAALHRRRPALSAQARAAVGYAEIFAYLEGEHDRETAVELIRRNTRRLAKSQMTWFRKFQCDWIDMSESLGRAAVAAAVLARWEEQLRGEA